MEFLVEEALALNQDIIVRRRPGLPPHARVSFREGLSARPRPPRDSLAAILDLTHHHGGGGGGAGGPGGHHHHQHGGAGGGLHGMEGPGGALPTNGGNGGPPPQPGGGAGNQQLGMQMHQMHLGVGANLGVPGAGAVVGGAAGGAGALAAAAADGASPSAAAAAELVHDLILDGGLGSGSPGIHGMIISSGGAAGSSGSSGGRPASPARLAYTSEKHPRATFHELNLIRKHHELCDVAINVAGRKIYAHKYCYFDQDIVLVSYHEFLYLFSRVILAACSPYFRAMFTGELAESRQTEVTIRDVDETAMEILVDFCYTAYIVVEESNVQTLLPAACLLQLQEIQDVCCEFLKRQLDPSNCLGIRSVADTHACRDLLRIADKFTQHHFQEVRRRQRTMISNSAETME